MIIGKTIPKNGRMMNITNNYNRRDAIYRVCIDTNNHNHGENRQDCTDSENRTNAINCTIKRCVIKRRDKSRLLITN